MSIERVWAGPQSPEAHDAISKWVSLHSFGHSENVWPGSSSYGVLRDGKPIAGVVYHDYRPQSGTVQYSGAATDRSWLMGPSLHYMFSYMFDALNCQMVITGNSEKNTGLHSLLERTDHKKHVIERAWDRDTAMFLWTLTKEQWLQNKLMRRSRQWAVENTDVKCA